MQAVWSLVWCWHAHMDVHRNPDFWHLQRPVLHCLRNEQATISRQLSDMGLNVIGAACSPDSQILCPICEDLREDQGHEDRAPILILQHNVDCVEKFPYLGSYMSSDGDSELELRARIGKAVSIFQLLRPIMVINYHQLECKVTSVHINCDPHGNLCVRNVEENGHDRSQVRRLPSPLPTCNIRHLMERPCHK